MGILILFCAVSFTACAADCITPAPAPNGPIRAFPGAEGYGSLTVGGRGGRVIFVTNLKDYRPAAGLYPTNIEAELEGWTEGFGLFPKKMPGEEPIPGSLRAALEAEGPRTIIFRVGGTIELKDCLEIRNPYVTIAGQTAPGDGICIKNCGLMSMADEVIIRYITVRAGKEHPFGDALWVLASENVIVDHVTTSWGNDETLSATSAVKLKNLTVQWCIISEGMNTHDFWGHSMGSGIDGKGGLSFHHNLYAHNKRRNPRIGSFPGHYVNFDFRNNVIYNWNVSGFSGPDNEGTMNINYVGNYKKPGPDTGEHYSKIAFWSMGNTTNIYSWGNYIEGCPTCNDRTMIDLSDGGKFLEAPVEIPDWAAVTTTDAKTAYEQVLSSTGAGNTSRPRDPVDTRVIKDVINGTGKIIYSQKEVGGWPEYKGATPQTDTDFDGMPDEWEKKNGLDPYDNTDNNKDKDKDGYTNLEEFLNFLVMSKAG